MKNAKKIVAFMFVFLLVLEILPIQSDAAVKINVKKKTITVGGSVTLRIKGTKKKVKWSSSNKKVATVSSKGVVKGKRVGKTTITAKVAKKSLKCKITVKGNVTTREKDYSNKVKIVNEYTLPDGIGWYTRHFMIVKNTSDVTVDISTSSVAYSSDGSIISAASSSLYAIGAGCTSILYEPFETNKEVAFYETQIKAKASNYYKSVIQDLSYTKNNIDGGVVFQVTNNGDYDAEFVEGYVLFFLNGKLVEFDTAYFTDDSSKIAPGSTIAKQFNAYQNFDTIEFYLTGRR